MSILSLGLKTRSESNDGWVELHYTLLIIGARQTQCIQC